MAADYIADEAALDELLTSQSLVVVDCTAFWCGPCKLVAPLMDQLASEYENQVTVVKLDIDNNKPVAKRFGIKSIPAVLFFVLFAAGAFFGALVLNDGAAEQQKIKELQALVELRQQELVQHKKSVQNDIDSMSLQIGKLMAHSTRLNALGDRLTAVADINQEEFNLKEFLVGMNDAIVSVSNRLSVLEQQQGGLKKEEKNGE